MRTFDTDRLERLLSSRAKLPACAPAKPAPWAQAAVRYDFGGGKPDPASFPLAEIARSTAEMLESEGREALTYGALAGYDGLRDLICWKYEHLEGLNVERDEIFVTNGSSQAVGVIADAFLDAGDVVVTESPTFSGSLTIFRKHGVEAVGVPMDEQGIRTDALEATLRDLVAAGRRPKLIYTIDYYHNPAGPTLALDRRRELLKLAAEYETPVLEDEAYGDLRLDGEFVPSLYSLDQEGLVIRMGTLSKILGAGLRLGWIAAPPALIQRLMPLKQDWGTSPFVSRVATYYLRSHLDEHLQRLIGVYRAKRDAMLAGLERGLGDSATWSHPQGGFFVWVRLPEGTDRDRLVERAAERHVSFVGGASFFPNGSGAEFIRLAYSYASVEQIAEGTDQLCEAIRLAR